MDARNRDRSSGRPRRSRGNCDAARPARANPRRPDTGRRLLASGARQLRGRGGPTASTFRMQMRSAPLTPILDDGERVAVLVHDVALLDDPALMSAVAAATRLAVSNARLQAEVRERVAEVEASRRRIVAAADEQRRPPRARPAGRREPAAGPGRRARGGIDPELERQVVAARAELGELARGIHPASLTERGLAEALRELAERAGATFEGSYPAGASPGHGGSRLLRLLRGARERRQARRARLRRACESRPANGLLTVEVTDDGVGGADAAAGSGLQGLRIASRRSAAR